MLQPIGKYVKVEIVDTKTGLTMVKDLEDSQQKGTVLAVGDSWIEEGVTVTHKVAPGDVIVWAAYAESKASFEEDGKTVVLIPANQIMGVERG